MQKKEREKKSEKRKENSKKARKASVCEEFFPTNKNKKTAPKEENIKKHRKEGQQSYLFFVNKFPISNVDAERNFSHSDGSFCIINNYPKD